LKFGFSGANLSTNVQNHEDIISVVKLGEDLGYESAWFSDRLRDTFVTLSMCAVKTNRIKLCSGVVNPFNRHPVITARAIAAVDDVSRGRAVLGIGVGNHYEVANNLGYDPSMGYERVKETAMIARRLFGGDWVDFDGKFFKITNVKLGVSCRPDIPIYIAASGNKILKVAGEVADGVIIPYGESKALEKGRAIVREAASLGGRKPDSISFVGWLMMSITDDKRKTINSMRGFCALIVVLSPKEWLVRMGMKEDFIDSIKKKYIASHIDPRQESSYWKSSTDLVSDDIVELLTLVGTTSEISRRLEEFVKLGYDEFSFLFPSADLAQKREIVQTFAREIMPGFS
jgi:5,10-methylenetetrahydromethanopterin reductase